MSDPDLPPGTRAPHSGVITVAGHDVRVRAKPDPVYTTTCACCRNPFWYKKSQTLHSFNGDGYTMRVSCPWCGRGNYIPCDECGQPKETPDGQDSI